MRLLFGIHKKTISNKRLLVMFIVLSTYFYPNVHLRLICSKTTHKIRYFTKVEQHNNLTRHYVCQQIPRLYSDKKLLLLLQQSGARWMPRVAHSGVNCVRQSPARHVKDGLYSHLTIIGLLKTTCTPTAVWNSLKTSAATRKSASMTDRGVTQLIPTRVTICVTCHCAS